VRPLTPARAQRPSSSPTPVLAWAAAPRSW
jgi:hypothetical protein